MKKQFNYTKYFISLLAVLAIVCTTAFIKYRPHQPLIEIMHAPKEFTRRAGDFTANICGEFSPMVNKARYRLNDGAWRRLENAAPRVPPPLFTVELAAAELIEGRNTLIIEATSRIGTSEIREVHFQYDSAEIILPVTIDWNVAILDVQDGYWEVVSAPGSGYVRPKPGYEGYDRIIAVTGAFREGRRVRTELVFRGRVGESDWDYGFGILPLWGGRPDPDGVHPRRGWNFSLFWWFKRFNAVGGEFSFKNGGESAQWVGSYRKMAPIVGARYHILTETWPVMDGKGRHLYYRQRMKWWLNGKQEPDQWMTLDDVEGAPIPPGEYAVALVAYHCQVEFGPVTVEPIGSSVMTAAPRNNEESRKLKDAPQVILKRDVSISRTGRSR